MITLDKRIKDLRSVIDRAKKSHRQQEPHDDEAIDSSGLF